MKSQAAIKVETTLQDLASEALSLSRSAMDNDDLETAQIFLNEAFDIIEQLRG